MKKIFTLALLLLAMAGIAQQLNTGAGLTRADKDVNVNFLNEDFETFAIPGNMFGWTYTPTNVTESWEIFTGAAHSGTQCAGVSSDFNVQPQDEYLKTSTLDLTGTVDPNVSFWFKCPSRTLANDSGYCDMGFMGNISPVTGWNLWNSLTEPNWIDNIWFYVNIPLGGTFANQSAVFFTFRYYAPALESYGIPMYIDDVMVYDDAMGIDNTNEKTMVSTYPNPCSDFVCFAADQVITEISLYNATGALSASVNPQSRQFQLDLGKLCEGLYVARIFTEGGMTTKTITITR